MPKIIFENKNEIPEHLRKDATEVDGKFEVDATGVLNKNKELLKDNAKLRSEKETLQADVETAQADVAEWKTKAKLPAGKRIVDADVAELGEAAKGANLSKDELPSLKTENETLKAEKLKASRNESRAKAAAAAGLNAEKFTKLAETEDFDVAFEKVTEGDKEIEKPFAVTKGADGKEVKTAFSEFVTNHDRFSLVLDSLKDSGQPPRKTPFPTKEDGAPPASEFEAVRKEVEDRNKQRAETTGNGFAGAFGIKK